MTSATSGAAGAASLGGIDWPGLLAWSTQHHDGTNPSNFKPMTPEDREWLEAALKASLGDQIDPNARLKEAIEKIHGCDPAAQPAEVVSALTVMETCCDFPDCPRNLEKFGGVLALKKCFDGEGLQEQIVSESLSLLGLMLPHNPEVQRAALEQHGLLEALLALLDKPQLSARSQLKCVGAISALVRAAGEQRFVDLDGLTRLPFEAERPRVLLKSANLFKHMLYCRGEGIVTIPDAQVAAAGRKVSVCAEALSDSDDIQLQEVLQECLQVLEN